MIDAFPRSRTSSRSCKLAPVALMAGASFVSAGLVVVVSGRVVDVVVAVAADGDGVDAGPFIEQIAV